jgi:hypothetical protein
VFAVCSNRIYKRAVVVQHFYTLFSHSPPIASLVLIDRWVCVHRDRSSGIQPVIARHNMHFGLPTSQKDSRRSETTDETKAGVHGGEAVKKEAKTPAPCHWNAESAAFTASLQANVDEGFNRVHELHTSQGMISRPLFLPVHYPPKKKLSF